MEIELEKIRRAFVYDRFATNVGIVIDSVTEESVQCSLVLSPLHNNALNSVHGGAIFALGDFAFAVHCNLKMVTGSDIGATVGQSCSISYLKPTHGTKLIAKTACLSLGKNVSVYRVSIADDLGKDVAEMLCNAVTTTFSPRDFAGAKTK